MPFPTRGPGPGAMPNALMSALGAGMPGAPMPGLPPGLPTGTPMQYDSGPRPPDLPEGGREGAENAEDELAELLPLLAALLGVPQGLGNGQPPVMGGAAPTFGPLGGMPPGGAGAGVMSSPGPGAYGPMGM